MAVQAIKRIAAGSLLSAALAAQAFPEKSITILMPFAAGTSTDVIAREFGQSLSSVAKQAVVVDNKVGAEGTIAGQALVNAPADGHTLMFTSSSLPVLDPLMKKSMPYDVMTDFAPICSVARISNVMNISASSTMKSALDVVAAARAQPGKLTYAYTSTTTRLAAELFAQSAGVKLTGVPYKSSVAALTEVSSGLVDLMFIDHVTAAPFYQSGKLRALAVAGSERLKALPETPSAVQAGVPGYNVNVWFGIFAPARTPETVLAHVREVVARAMSTPANAANLEKRGLDALPLCGAAMTRMQSREMDLWRSVIRKAGIEPQ